MVLNQASKKNLTPKINTRIKSDSDFKVLQISIDLNGGAGLATKRLSQALSKVKVSNDIYLKTYPLKNDDDVSIIQDKEDFQSTSKIDYLSFNNIYPNHTFFTHIYETLTNEKLETLSSNYDIINIHWVTRLLSLENIAFLSHQNKPLIWTIHDKSPLTGGCHYFHGCDKWKSDCNNCPQLKNTYNNFPWKILEAKKKFINFKNITLVVLNKHFKTLVVQSPLFNESRIEIIPNSIDTELYKPQTPIKYQSLAQSLNNKKIILFVSSYKSKIKGYKEFCEMSHNIKDKKNYHILIVGEVPETNDIALPFTNLGYVSQQDMIELYNISDITVVSSIEDNLPNVCIESLACGTPVVGFKVGGIPDLIIDGYNGFTVQTSDCKALAHALTRVLEGKDLSKNCREFTIKKFSLEIQGQRYKELYQDVLAKKKSNSNIKNTNIKNDLLQTTMLPDIDNSFQLMLKDYKFVSIENELRDFKESKSYKLANAFIKNRMSVFIKRILKKFKLH